MEKQPQNRNAFILGIIGGVLLLEGLIFDVIGCIDFISAIRAQVSPQKLWCVFLAFPLWGLGGGFFVFGFKTSANNTDLKPTEAQTETQNEQTTETQQNP